MVGFVGELSHGEGGKIVLKEFESIFSRKTDEISTRNIEFELKLEA
jgi:hypothetical protein